jgi:DNA-binding MarR family transcriptional regulator
MESIDTPPDPDDDIDPVIAALLQQLWSAAQAPGAAAWSLAKLAKQAGLPMSTLRRVLTQLGAAGLTAVTDHEDGRPTAVLTPAGRELCAALFDAP